MSSFRRPLGVLLAASIGLVWPMTGCGDDDEGPTREAPSESPEAPPAPSPEPAETSACRTGEPTPLHRGALLGGVGISVLGESGIVAMVGPTGVRAAPIDGEGHPTGPGGVAEHARGQLFAVGPAGEMHAAILLRACEGAVCLAAQFFDREGSPATEIVSEPIAEIWTQKHASTAEALLVAVGHENAPPDLLRFEPTENGAARTRLPATAGTRTEVLGLAAAGDRWALIYRVGAAEGEDSRVLLASSDRETPVEVEGLHDALAIESFALTEEGVVAIAAFEFSRPGFVAITADGASEPVFISPDGPLPPPFRGRRRAHVRRGSDRIVVDVETGAGDPIARQIPILRHPTDRRPSADIARVGSSGFLVATVRDDQVVTLRLVCD